ncbi:hypothetical protein H7A76_19310 [Pseudomonas sp. MSSRFD41]|nr:hypothetical protein [Pseudomonas sp. MSSRFD41]
MLKDILDKEPALTFVVINEVNLDNWGRLVNLRVSVPDATRWKPLTRTRRVYTVGINGCFR